MVAADTPNIGYRLHSSCLAQGKPVLASLVAGPPGNMGQGLTWDRDLHVLLLLVFVSPVFTPFPAAHLASCLCWVCRVLQRSCPAGRCPSCRVARGDATITLRVCVLGRGGRGGERAAGDGCGVGEHSQCLPATQRIRGDATITLREGGDGTGNVKGCQGEEEVVCVG